MELLQVSARMFFRAIVVCMLILNYDKDFIWGLPLGFLVGLLSEAKWLTTKH